MVTSRESTASEIPVGEPSFRSSVVPSEEYINTYITIPPDGGWGWIIVVASFLCNFVIDGTVYTFGIFLKDISATYKTDPTNVAVATSLMTGFSFISGPITCALLNRLGFQITGFVGGLITASAFFFSTLTPTITGFLVVFGVIGGCGQGLVFVPSVVVIGFYFERWRALATSIAVSGSACGIIGFPILIETLLSDYDWQTKFQIIAIICILIGCLTLLYRPLKLTHVLKTKDQKIVQVIFDDDDESIITTDDKKPGIIKKIYNKIYKTKEAKLNRDSTVLMYFPSGPSTSSVFVNVINEGSATTFIRPTASKTVEGRLDKLSTVYEDVSSSKLTRCRKFCCDYKCCNWCCGHPHIKNRPMYKEDIFYGGSVYTLLRYAQSKPSQISSKMRSIDYTISVTKHEIIREEVRYKCCPDPILRTLNTMLNFELFKLPHFILFAISGFFTTLGMYIPFIYLIQRATEIDISEDISPYFYTVLGVSNAVGRILSGIISSLPKGKPLVVSYVSLVICGISTFGSFFLEDVYWQFIYSAIFGLTIASFVSLRTPIIVELLGLENLTNAFGLQLLCNGVAAFVGMPLAGAIVKLADSFNSSFLFSGSTLLLSAVLMMPVKRISEWKTNE